MTDKNKNREYSCDEYPRTPQNLNRHKIQFREELYSTIRRLHSTKISHVKIINQTSF